MGVIHQFDDAAKLSVAAAEWICEYVAQRSGTRFSLLLSGGNTPKQLFDLLSNDEYRDRIDWQNVHVFFGDERFVSFDDDRNNGRMAFEHLLSKVPVPVEQVHYIQTDIDQVASALKYEEILRDYFTGHTFDLSLLGMGDDGHTLSLFPGTDAVHESVNWVMPSVAPVEPKSRITITSPVVMRSACIAFLISGSSKAEALKQVIDGPMNIDRFPAQIFRDHNNVHWFADRDATRLLK